MKMAIASDDGITISAHFGRTKGFVVLEVEGKKVKNREYRLNTFTGHVRGLHLPKESEPVQSHDHHGPILQALSDCQVVISNGMGRRIHQDLKNHHIRPFLTSETNVDMVLQLYFEGKISDETERLH